MTQKQMILRHFQRFGKITDLDAYVLYSIRRLGARIWDLRAEGHKIRTQNTKEKNRFGEVRHFATCILERAKGGDEK